MKFSGVFLGEKLIVEVESKEKALIIIKKLGDFFDLDSKISEDNNIVFNEEELVR